MRYISSCEVPPGEKIPRDRVYKDFSEAKDTAVKLLWGKGIEDDITIQLVDFEGERRCWLALYLLRSQFRGLPVIQVNENTQGVLYAMNDHEKILTVMLESILHEYGHIIAEWGRERDPKITDLVKRYSPDEEVFAEDFMKFMLNRIRSPILEEVSQRFLRTVF